MPRATRTELNHVVIEVTQDTRQKIKVLASLEAQTMIDWLEWMVSKAYEAKLHANKRNESK